MNERPLKRVGSSSTRAKKKPIASGKDAECAWQFVNLSEMQHAKDPELRKLVRVNAMRHYRRSQPKRRDMPAHEAHSATNPRCRTMTSELSPCATLDLCEEDRDDELSLQDESLSWPSQWDQQLREAQGTCDSWPPPPGSESLRQPASSNGEGTLSSSDSKSMVASPILAPRRSPMFLLGSGNSDPFNSFPIRDNPRSSELLYHCKPSKTSKLLTHIPLAVLLLPHTIYSLTNSAFGL